MKKNIDKTDYHKMKNIVENILKHPDFSKKQMTISEDRVIKFYFKNEKQFKATFEKEENFPSTEYNETRALFFTVLKDIIIEWLLPRVEGIIELIDFTFLNTMLGSENAHIQKAIKDFYLDAIKEKDVRSEYFGTRNIIVMNYLNRYLKEFEHRRGYGNKELFKIQGIDDIDQYVNFFKCCAILRNIAKIPFKVKYSKGEKIISYKDVEELEPLKDIYLSKIESEIVQRFSAFPASMINIALSSVIDKKYIEERFDPSGQFLEIIVERSKSFVLLDKQDARGAEPPDKSWFNTARRNIKYYGFDPTFLDGFYFIAGDNRW